MVTTYDITYLDNLYNSVKDNKDFGNYNIKYDNNSNHNDLSLLDRTIDEKISIYNTINVDLKKSISNSNYGPDINDKDVILFYLTNKNYIFDNNIDYKDIKIKLIDLSYYLYYYIFFVTFVVLYILHYIYINTNSQLYSYILISILVIYIIFIVFYNYYNKLTL